jgi:hypothetical protein
VRVIATTVVRESLRGKQYTGFIYDVDWSAQRVLRRLPVPDPRYPESDSNPRGGVRGGRGVAVTPAGIAVANHDGLSIYDDDWRLVDEISHPLLVGLHEVHWDGEHLWVTATAIDVLLKVNLSGSVEVAWDPRTSELAERYGLESRLLPLDGSIDFRTGTTSALNQCHLNGVARSGEAVIVNCGYVRRLSRSLPIWVRAAARLKHGLRLHGRFGEIPRYPGRSAVIALNGGKPPEVLVELEKPRLPTHNGQLLDDSRVAVNDSADNTLRIFDSHGAQLLAVPIPGTWLRGLEPLDGRRTFVGTSPAAVVLVDVEEGRIEQALTLSENPYEAVHGLVLYPSFSHER